MKLGLISVLSFAFLLLAAEVNASDESHSLLFCYENKEVAPHYLGEGTNVPKQKPGAAIEIMQNLDVLLPNTQIQYVRAPWKRCLNDLKLGKVDALIGRYTEERAEFAIYPKDDKGELDVNKAFSTTSSCFIHDQDLDLSWDGNNLQVAQPVGLIAPRGYSLVDDLKALGFDIYEATTIQLAHKLLFSKKFSVSLSDCNLVNKPDFIVENPIPVKQTYGFLVFSHAYFWQKPEQAEFIWQQLETIDKKRYYQKYTK